MAACFAVSHMATCILHVHAVCKVPMQACQPALGISRHPLSHLCLDSILKASFSPLHHCARSSRPHPRSSWHQVGHHSSHVRCTNVKFLDKPGWCTGFSPFGPIPQVLLHASMHLSYARDSPSPMGSPHAQKKPQLLFYLII